MNHCGRADYNGADMTAISTGHDAHRRLRAPLDRLFARANIMRIEPRVAARAERLCDRLNAYKGTGEVVNLTDALSSLTTDIISSIILKYSRSLPTTSVTLISTRSGTIP